MMAEYKKALGVETQEVPNDGNESDSVGAKHEPAANDEEEHAQLDQESWFDDAAADKTHALTNKRIEERRKRRKEKLRRQRANGAGTDHSNRTNKIVILLAWKHTTAEGKLFIPLSCLQAHNTSRGCLDELAMKDKAQTEATSADGGKGGSQEVIVYSVNTEKAAGISLDEVYSSYYSRMRRNRKKNEEAALEVPPMVITAITNCLASSVAEE